MENTVKQRIMLFIQMKGIKVGTFERMCGLSNAYLKSVNNSPSLSKIDKICETFPELNKDWLITGRGEMFSAENNEEKSDSTQFITIPDNELVEALRNHIQDLRAERDRLLIERDELRAEIERLRQTYGITEREKETA